MPKWYTVRDTAFQFPIRAERLTHCGMNGRTWRTSYTNFDCMRFFHHVGVVEYGVWMLYRDTDQFYARECYRATYKFMCSERTASNFYGTKADAEKWLLLMYNTDIRGFYRELG